MSADKKIIPAWAETEFGVRFHRMLLIQRERAARVREMKQRTTRRTFSTWVMHTAPKD